MGTPRKAFHCCCCRLRPCGTPCGKPPVRDHIYHPEFAGSFGLKAVLPALVPALGYDELEIQDGGTAAAALESLLLEPDAFDDAERRALRADLEAYCALDTWALVQLAVALRKLSGAEGSA
jgi:hypothetical protein